MRTLALAAGLACIAALIVSDPAQGQTTTKKERAAIEAVLKKKWADTKVGLRKEEAVLQTCRKDPEPCPAPAKRYLELFEKARKHHGLVRLKTVNRFDVNITPVSDLTQWGVSDKWSLPFETLSTGKADCEDRVILKYALLRMLKEKVRITFIRLPDELHAVIEAKLDGRWLVLDDRKHEDDVTVGPLGKLYKKHDRFLRFP